MPQKEIESNFINVLSEDQQQTLKLLRKMLRKKSVENPSDVKWAQDALDNLHNGIKESTMQWLTSLVKRKGKRFSLSNAVEVSFEKKDSQK